MERAKDYSTKEEEEISKRLNIPRNTIEDFKTEQDLRIAELWKADPNFENTSLDFLLEEEIDKFTNELRICTFRSRYFGFPYKHPIDLLYISKPQGEGFYILYTDNGSIDYSGSVIFNINGRTNVELKRDGNDPLLDGKTREEIKFGYVSFLPISKEDFLKCCHAKHLSVRIKEVGSSIDYESDCDDLIPFFQMLYNRVCDNNMFVENKAVWREQIRDCFENNVCHPIQEHKKRIKELEKEDKKFKIALIGAIIGGTIGMIGLFLLIQLLI